ncbi:excalibur calcium-binding domain-containing protein [Pseudonocardia sp. WMMC193]|uniref:excalibur calcium-binding domain-containing protein n=1 Tax=Pseudonocardia sp. WMMC193 TaxID=2911965 RepID=UPI001F41C388|nr:excalibur calcium-binding domain-containing protein [Pseudonocardia sp. WMMC193]MCF7551633.1 excalibur calcium-binding domain-containing protein [Pseudonocardia sp. WMMC193]
MTATQHWTSTVPPTPPTGNRPATTGFVLGVLGLVVGWIPVVGLIVTVPALLISRAGRRRFRSGAADTAGRSTAGMVLGLVGTAICVVMTVVAIAGGASAEPRPVAVPAPVAAVPPAPVLLVVPNVVGMSDAQARETLRAAGFSTVVVGPSTGPQPGVAAGTVTAQLPGTGARASATDPITLGEAAEPPVVAPAAVAPAPAVPAAAPAPAAVAPATRAPAAQAPAARAPQPLVAPAPRAADPAPASSGGASYKNCTEARNAGAAPLRRGEPGYSTKLDRDGDGIACE